MLAALFGSCSAGVKASPVGQRQTLVHHVFKLAGVVHLRHRIGVGHLVRLDEIAPPQLDPVHADLACGFVHQSLHDKNGFRAARTPVGAGGCGVGQNRLEMEIHRLDVIHAGLHPGANQYLNGNARARGISAHIGARMHAQAQNLAGGVQRQFGGGFNVPAMRAGQKFFATFGRPFH